MRKQKLDTIKFGNWFYDPNEFKLLHKDTAPCYYVDVNELETEAQAIEWLNHLEGRISERDVDDYVRIVKVLLCLDRSLFRKMNRKPSMQLDRVAGEIVENKQYNKHHEKRQGVV